MTELKGFQHEYLALLLIPIGLYFNIEELVILGIILGIDGIFQIWVFKNQYVGLLHNLYTRWSPIFLGLFFLIFGALSFNIFKNLIIDVMLMIIGLIFIILSYPYKTLYEIPIIQKFNIFLDKVFGKN